MPLQSVEGPGDQSEGISEEERSHAGERTVGRLA